MNNIKKSLLYIITQAEWGGAQRYIFDLAANLVDEFDITVATGIDGDDQELDKRLKDYKIKRFVFKHLRREINPYHDILAIFEIARFLRQNHFDIIHLNSSKAGVIGALANAVNRFFAPLRMTKKIIYTAHGWVYLEPLPFWRRWIYLGMEKIAARLRDATIVLSEKEKKVALRYGTAKKNSVFVIPNGIDLTALNFLSREEARKRLKINNDEIVIGTIANLYKTKGLEYLIEAIKILNIQSAGWRTISNIKTVIIGEGDERNNLQTKIKELGLENNISLSGSIPDAYKYLKAFDIFVLPSVKEGFPYTILEAMAAGLPIVATEVGAIPEILENQKTGVLMPPADSQALTEAFVSLIKNPEHAKQLGANAQEAVKKFDLKTMIEKTKIGLGSPPIKYP